MRKELTELNNPDPGIGVGMPEPGGDDFLGKVNTTMGNFRELIKLVMQFKAMQGEAGQFGAGGGAPSVAGPPPGAGKDRMIQAFLKQYGTMKVGELLQELEPYTLNQLYEAFNAGRPGK